MSQSVFATLYEHWIWVGPPVFLLALAALVLAIAGVVKTVKRAHLFKLTLREEQRVQFQEAGTVVLSTEGPRLSNRFRGVKFELRGVDGDAVPRRPALFRARTSGISTVRTEDSIFEIPRPGRYLLTAAGLGAERDKDAKHALVFMKPHLRRAVVFVVGIVLAAGLTVVSLIFFLLRLWGVALES
jgi:hypothetical protein